MALAGANTMKIISQRFGAFAIDPRDIIHFPEGLIGFPAEQQFVLLRHREASPIGWLQSTTRPDLALPVVSVDALALDDPSSFAMARLQARAGAEEAEPEYAVMAVLCAPPGQRASVNLLAPIVVDIKLRKGAQMLLESTQYSTAEPFVLRQTASVISAAATPVQPAAESPAESAPTSTL
jgi:flagellar assembly factor FliW